MSAQQLLIGIATAVALIAPTADAQRRNRDVEDYRSRIDTTVPLRQNGTVDLSLIGGEIRVTAWDRNEVRLAATSEYGELQLETSPSRVSLRVREVRNRVGDTHYEVTVPRGTRVQMGAVSGDIFARGTTGEIEANTVSGDVEVQNARGRIILGSVSGDVVGSELDGDVRAGVVSGDLSLQRVTGELEVKSVSGELDLRDITSTDVRVGTVSGEITYAGSFDPNGRYDFNAHSGDIRLWFAGEPNATMDVETFSGEIYTDFPIRLEPREGEVRPRRAAYVVGRGGARIDVETFSGDIHLERGPAGRQ